MGSPFPGMDPYLEGELWQEFHETLVSEIRAQLMPRLVPKVITSVPEKAANRACRPEGVERPTGLAFERRGSAIPRCSARFFAPPRCAQNDRLQPSVTR